MKAQKILSIAIFGLAINIGLVLSFLFCLHSEPIQNISMTTQRDAIIVFGNNQLGFTSIRVFKGWSDMNSYLKGRGLKLPDISYTQTGTDLNARVLKSTGQIAYYRLFWSPQAQAFKMNPQYIISTLPGVAQRDLVLHTPDPDSALKMLDYLRYSQLQMSNFGFSLPIVIDDPAAI